MGDSPRSPAFNRFLLPVASEPSHLVVSQDKGLRQTAKRICVKQPSEFASNSQADLRQTAKQICIKQPSRFASNSQVKLRQIAKYFSKLLDNQLIMRIFVVVVFS